MDRVRLGDRPGDLAAGCDKRALSLLSKSDLDKIGDATLRRSPGTRLGGAAALMRQIGPGRCSRIRCAGGGAVVETWARCRAPGRRLSGLPGGVGGYAAASGDQAMQSAAVRS